jgi:hypothetical protein
MAGKVVTRRVFVWDKPVDIVVYRQKTVWIAAGEYLGTHHECKGLSDTSAARAWVEAAKHHSD